MLDLKFHIKNRVVSNYNIGNFYINVSESIHGIKKVQNIAEGSVPLVSVEKYSSFDAENILTVNTWDFSKRIFYTFDGYYENKYNPKRIRSYSSKLLEVPCDQILLTSISNDLGEPCFYRHELEGDLASLIALKNENKISLFSKGKEISSSKFLVLEEGDETTSAHETKKVVVAHSFEQKDLDSLVYVEYKIGSIQYKSVLKNEPLFVKYDYFLNYDFYSSNPDAKLLGYKYSKKSDRFVFEVSEDYSKVFWKERPSFATISTINSFKDHSIPWFLRVPRINWLDRDSSSYRINNYYNDFYSGTQNHFVIKRERGEILNDFYVKFNLYGLKTDSTYRTSIVLYKDGVPKRAFTEDSSKINTYAYEKLGIVWEEAFFEPIYTQGILKLNKNISDYDYVLAELYVEKHHYDFYDVNLNPFQSEDLIGKTYVFYLKPNASSLFDNIYWILLDEDGVIVDYSQDGSDGAAAITSPVGKYFSQAVNVFEDKNSKFLGLVFKVGEDFYDDNSENLYLAHIKISDEISELGSSRFTPIVYDPLQDKVKAAQTYPYFSNSGLFSSLQSYGSIYLKNKKLISIPWPSLKDYNNKAKISMQDAKNLVSRSSKLSSKRFVTLSGVPNIFIESIDYANKKLYISYKSLPSYKGSDYYGNFLVGNSRDAINTSVASVESCYKLHKSIELDLSSYDTFYLQFETFIDIDGATLVGPKSNIIAFSFGE